MIKQSNGAAPTFAQWFPKPDGYDEYHALREAEETDQGPPRRRR